MTDRPEDRVYWIQVFTVNTWRQFLEAGGNVTGFRETRWGHVQKLKEGDTLLCYLSGVSKWIGALEVTSQPYLDTKRIWTDGLFPCQAEVRILLGLDLATAVPMKELRDRLSIFRTKSWGLYVISSPLRWKTADGNEVLKSLREAQVKVK